MEWYQWLGAIITPGIIATLLTGLMNHINNERRIKADVISMARIEWIKSLRDISSDYVCAMIDYVNHLGVVSVQKKKQGVNFDENIYLLETKEYIKAINQSGAKMKLYLPVEIKDSNKLNLKIRNKMDEVDDAVKKCFEEHNKENTERFDSVIGEFVSLVGEYLKTEWNIVKTIK